MFNLKRCETCGKVKFGVKKQLIKAPAPVHEVTSRSLMCKKCASKVEVAVNFMKPDVREG